jgi:dihydrodipicolinate synthase/N-acetylneuraminate lyase
MSAEADARPAPPLRLRRAILGVSAVLLPFASGRTVDWHAFESLVRRTVDAGLLPAVNMDTGYVQFLDEPARNRVLEVAAAHSGTRSFVAGAFVADVPGAAFVLDAYLRAIDTVSSAGGTPVIFPSHGLSALGDEEWVAAHVKFGEHVDRFIAFELGPMFVSYGRIYSLSAYESLLGVPACVGAKHSSLSRMAEWDRLALRDRLRPEFHVFTGNDLAIDMVCYGSDYLLGLSTFAPHAFAERDRRWAVGDRSFQELNDLLQYLGYFAFRPPVPAYRHDAAIFLALRGEISSAVTPPGAPRRFPANWEASVLADIRRRLEALL